MKRNATEVEQRLLVILKKNSRKTILEAAHELGVSRITAKKAFDALLAEGRIRNFTITVNEDMKDLVLVHVLSPKGIPQQMIIENFRLIDGSYTVVMYYENLPKIRNLTILDVQIATERAIYDNTGRIQKVHCDYCQKEITAENQIVFEIQGKTHYACCPSCERGLKKRREFGTIEET